MQLTKVLYRGLLSSAGYIILALLVIVNITFYKFLESDYQSATKAHNKAFSVITAHADESQVKAYVSKLSTETRLVKNWNIIDKSNKIGSEEAIFLAKSPSVYLFESEQQYLLVTHATFLALNMKSLIIFNFLFAVTCLLSITLTQRRLFKYWRVLIQLETWASRQAKDDNFKFFITTEDFHLVNTVRRLNQQRIQAKKGGQEIDHMIRSQTFLDKLTGLGNRRYFDNRLEALLQEEGDVNGAVFFIHFAPLDKLRTLQGKRATSHYVKNYASLLTPYLDDIQQSIVARLSYSEFAILIPYGDQTLVEKIASELVDKSERFALPNNLDQGRACYIGVKMFNQTETPFHILAEADLALRAAQLQGPSSWFMYESNNLPISEVKGSVRWRIALNKALEQNNFLLDLKPVLDFNGNVMQYEANVKMIDEEEKLISSNIFMPMARKSGVIKEIDKVALSLVTEELKHQDSSKISVKIHIDSLLDRDFDLWLVKFLKKHVKNMPRVILEISEFDLTHNVKKVRQLLKIVKRYKGNVMVSQVGLYVVDLGYLNHIEVDSLKLHHSITGLVLNNSDNQLFIRSLVGVANAQKQQVIATGLDSEMQIERLKKLGVDAYQRN
ncbi:EAL domain-containing protein [Psychrosphaera haliotis]|uniref:EAL domain-containing protein n=1 Tax=Psychrosphaera haliotis TaxID=555083 RepID=UPI0031CFD251